MDNVTRFRLNLTGLLLLAVVWAGTTLGALVYATLPGNGGAILLAGFAALVGFGLFREALTHVGRSLDRYPLPREARR